MFKSLSSPQEAQQQVNIQSSMQYPKGKSYNPAKVVQKYLEEKNLLPQEIISSPLEEIGAKPLPEDMDLDDMENI